MAIAERKCMQNSYHHMHFDRVPKKAVSVARAAAEVKAEGELAVLFENFQKLGAWTLSKIYLVYFPLPVIIQLETVLEKTGYATFAVGR